MSDWVCEKCREPIAAEARTCPHCGYDPAAEFKKNGDRQVLLAVLCFVTVIGAPLGILLLIQAFRTDRRRKNAKPAVRA